MRLPEGGRHQFNGLVNGDVAMATLGGDRERTIFQPIKPSTGGVSPIEHRAREPLECGEEVSDVPAGTPSPDGAEEFGGESPLDSAGARPVGDVGSVGFLANQEHAGDDEHNFVGVEGCGKTTELDATSRAKLGEVDESVLADVDVESSVVFGSLDFSVQGAGGVQRTPLAEISTLGILSVQNRGELESETSYLLAPVQDLGRRGRTARSASVNRHMDSTLSCTAHPNRTLCSDCLEESEEFEDMLESLIALEDRGDELAFFESVGRANGRVFVRFPSFASEAGSLNNLAVGESNLGNRESVAVVANPNGDVGGNLSFDLDSEGRLVVYHGSEYALSKPAWQDLFSIIFESKTHNRCALRRRVKITLKYLFKAEEVYDF